MGSEMCIRDRFTRFDGSRDVVCNIKHQICDDKMCLPPATKTVSELLAFYMGKNTEERQQFIIKNLRVEADIVEDKEEELVEAA